MPTENQSAAPVIIEAAINGATRKETNPNVPKSVEEVADDALAAIDAGAHLDRMCGSSYPTQFLADTLRGRRLVSLEWAVHAITGKVSELFGLRGRGTLVEGACADIVVFDPDTIGSEPATLVRDLPGGAPRMTAASTGIARVYVNGIETVVDGEATGARPGAVLRSGRDTTTVTVH